jgi:hypothetical protein
MIISLPVLPVMSGGSGSLGHGVAFFSVTETLNKGAYPRCLVHRAEQTPRAIRV